MTSPFTAANELETVTRLALQTLTPREVQPGKIYLVATGDGSISEHDYTGDQYRDTPKHIAGVATLADVDSLCHYWDLFATSPAQVYADRSRTLLTAVFDHHAADAPDWGRHRANLGLIYSEAWKAWTTNDGVVLSQLDFAEFLEANRADVVDPSSAELLEVAQSLQVNTKVTYQSGVKLVSGQKQLTWVEESTATAGDRGTLAVPAEFTLRLPVFRGATVADQITARLRHRVDGSGKLALGFKLNRPSEVVDAAFEGVVAAVAAHIGRPVLRGTPTAGA